MGGILASRRVVTCLLTYVRRYTYCRKHGCSYNLARRSDMDGVKDVKDLAAVIGLHNPLRTPKSESRA